MELVPLFSAALVVAALFAWINHRFIRLPTTIGVMLIALVLSLLLVLLERAGGLSIAHRVEGWLVRMQVQRAILEVMLALLLFAGALHVDLGELLRQRRVIALLSTVGVIFTTFAVGGLVHVACGALGLEIGLMECLLFGALISPTDPIAVLGILKSAGVPRSLEAKIAGESLFNDGIGVVVFVVLASLVAGGAHGHAEPSVSAVASLFAREVGGAVVLGLAGGFLAYALLRSVDDHKLEVLITLALCMGLYELCLALHASAPLAVVFAGLLIGNRGRSYAMSSNTVEHLDTFWELVDEILNVLLFVLIGLEVLVLELSGARIAAGLVAIPLVLLARFASVGLTVTALRRTREFTPHAVKLMTWAGLRGGISVALALSIDPGVASRGLILSMTYTVVVFSIAVQGLTIGRLAQRIPREAA